MLSIDDLKVSSFFQDLKDEYLEKIVKCCNEETYHADDFIVREGEEAIKLYVLLEGTVSFQIHLKEHQDVVVSTVEEKGYLFGWSSLVEPRCYSASVKCLEETKVIALLSEGLEAVFSSDPVMGLIVMKKVASLIEQRLRTTRNRLANCIS